MRLLVLTQITDSENECNTYLKQGLESSIDVRNEQH